MFQKLSSIPLALILAGSLAAQTGKEALGPVVGHALSSPPEKSIANAIWVADAGPGSKDPTLVTKLTKGIAVPGAKTQYKAVIIHGSTWDYDATNKSAKMISSEWQVFHPSATGIQQDQQNGWPRASLLYGNSEVLFVGLACFTHDDKANGPMEVDPKYVSISYKIATTQLTPANLTNLTSVLNAWLGTKAPAPLAGQGVDKCQKGLIAEWEIRNKLPYDISITPSAKVSFPVQDAGAGGGRGAGAGNGAGAAAAAGGRGAAGGGGGDTGGGGTGGTDTQKTQDCSADTTASCTNAARTFHNIDREYWDLSAGLALPGVREPQYSSSNPALQTVPVRHNDFYGMLDLYPFAQWGDKNSWFPHLAVGIPVTGKVFYRPFFGIAESLTGAPYFQTHNVPQVSVMWGVVYLNQEIAKQNPAGSGLTIGHSRTLKGTFGLEISLSPLLSKIKAIGGGSGGGGTGGANAGAGGNGKGAGGGGGGSN